MKGKGKKKVWVGYSHDEFYADEVFSWDYDDFIDEEQRTLEICDVYKKPTHKHKKKIRITVETI